jgi:hypothetical protein
MNAMTRLGVFVTISLVGVAAAVVRSGGPADVAGWDPASEAAKFMSDAATALAVLSLTHTN